MQRVRTLLLAAAATLTSTQALAGEDTVYVDVNVTSGSERVLVVGIDGMTAKSDAVEGYFTVDGAKSPVLIERDADELCVTIEPDGSDSQTNCQDLDDKDGFSLTFDDEFAIAVEYSRSDISNGYGKLMTVALHDLDDCPDGMVKVAIKTEVPPVRYRLTRDGRGGWIFTPVYTAYRPKYECVPGKIPDFGNDAFNPKVSWF